MNVWHSLEAASPTETGSKIKVDKDFLSFFFLKLALMKK